MRSDAYSRHMATHAREILMRDKRQTTEAVEERSVCVYYAKRGKQTAGIYHGPYTITTAACCLVCGQHAACHNASPRFEYEQWCDHCDKPFRETCAGCNYHSVRKCPTEFNSCEKFVEKHNASCGAQWESVAAWFDLRKPAPKLKIADRKTDRKLERKTLSKPAAAATPVAPKPVEPVGVPGREVCDVIAKLFPDDFDCYNYREDDYCEDSDIDSDDEDAEERREEALEEHRDNLETRNRQRAMTYGEMIGKIATSYNKYLGQVRGQNELIRKQVAKQMAVKQDEHRREIQEIEREKTNTVAKLLETQNDMEMLQSEMRRMNRMMEQLRKQNDTMKSLLKSNEIEFDPSE
jgi:hypothetical protein